MISGRVVPSDEYCRMFYVKDKITQIPPEQHTLAMHCGRSGPSVPLRCGHTAWNYFQLFKKRVVAEAKTLELNLPWDTTATTHPTKNAWMHCIYQFR